MGTQVGCEPAAVDPVNGNIVTGDLLGNEHAVMDEGNDVANNPVALVKDDAAEKVVDSVVETAMEDAAVKDHGVEVTPQDATEKSFDLPLTFWSTAEVDEAFRWGAVQDKGQSEPGEVATVDPGKVNDVTDELFGNEDGDIPEDNDAANKLESVRHPHRSWTTQLKTIIPLRYLTK
ncbi:uncharacterized protein LOC141629801 [Silene latifolia]|uniref:uncharacterized protein LOC141629801 n=1 Tax=Silene latifolia TaxID=37657 RepID=UPI003D785AEC